jgi:hypothetical protein
MFLRNLETWVRGLVSAGISGATAVISVSVVIPDVFTSGGGAKKLGMVCLIAFVVSIAKFISMHPLPDEDKK